MSKTVEFFFDFVSPTAFIAHEVLPKIVDRAGAALTYRPMFLGGVMKATGNSPPAMVPAKGAWMAQDLSRWCKKYGVSYAFNPNFPMNTLAAMRGACAIQDQDQFGPYVDAMFKAAWQDEANLGDPEVIAKIVSDLDMDAEEFAGLCQKPQWKQKLKANTDEAVERGAFGAPTIFVGDELFFGQDRLFMVSEALGVHISDVVPGY